MGVGTRILLALYTLVTLALTVLLAGVLLPLLPEREWANEIAYLTGRPEAYAGLLAYFLVGVHLFLCAFSARKGQGGAEICLVTGTAGRVHVSVAAVRSVVLRRLRLLPGLRRMRRFASRRRGDRHLARIKAGLGLDKATGRADAFIIGRTARLAAVEAGEAVRVAVRRRLPAQGGQEDQGKDEGSGSSDFRSFSIHVALLVAPVSMGLWGYGPIAQAGRVSRAGLLNAGQNRTACAPSSPP